MSLEYRWWLSIAFVSTVGAAIFQLWIPLLLGDAVDTAGEFLESGTGGDSAARSALYRLAWMLLGFSIIRGVLGFFHTFIGEALGQHISYRLRLAYYEKLQRLSFSYHDRVHTGDLITRGILDIEGVRMFINAGILRLFLLAILVGAGAYLVLIIDWQLGLLSLSFIPFMAWRATVARLKLRAGWLILQERFSTLTKVMDENLGGIRVVRAFGAQDYEMRKFDVASNDAMSLTNQQIGVRVRNTTVMTFAFYIAMTLVLLIGGIKIIDGELTPGNLATFIAFMGILQQPVRQVGMLVNAVARASSTGTRLFDVLDLVPDIRDKPDAQNLVITEGVLKFDHVDFSYGDEAVLRDISFEARPGHTIGLVGPPGSGKSTIAHLIPRYYDVSGGRITVDGQDIRDVRLESLRTTVGVVEQDTFLFTTSVENNVAYGDPWAETDRVQSATGSAQLHDYVARLPLGYETLIGERGVSLSGGQRQRLSIARSIMLKPSLLIFDDSTAAIDAGTEQRIRAALRDVTNDRAVIIISHRLSSLMHADEILFIDKGRVIERGTHQQLLELGGNYRDLYELQIRPSDETRLKAGFDAARNGGSTGERS